MGGVNLQAMVEVFRQFVQKKGWSIVTEKEIQSGYQLIVTDGATNIPVALYRTGKVLVQGKPGVLQSELKAWVYGSSVPSQTINKNGPTQSPLMDIPVPPSLSVSSKPHMTGIARIGSDESGKGDYFGPLVVAAVYVDSRTEAQLLTLNVRDSKQLTDSTILSLADEIKTICRGHGVVLTYLPERYNKLYQQTSNLNLLLAEAHAQVIATLQKKVSSDLAIVDQFGNEALVREALIRAGSKIMVEQRHRAEDDTAVAAASIIARAEFVHQMVALSKMVGFDLPKGASNPRIVEIGREIVASGGLHTLGKVAKLHFKITGAILQGQDATF
jgi:ribonuclease HIII